MFFSKPNTVLFLIDESISFYAEKDREKNVLEFPASVVKKSQIIDIDKLKELVEEFIARNSLGKKQAVLILGREIIFEKVIPLGISANKEEQERQIVKESKLKSGNVVVKRLKDNKNFYLVATNGDFYQDIKYLLEDFGWKIKMVIPVTMFEGFAKGKELSFVEVEQILRHADALKMGDFLSPGVASYNTKEPEKEEVEAAEKVKPSGEAKKEKEIKESAEKIDTKEKEEEKESPREENKGFTRRFFSLQNILLLIGLIALSSVVVFMLLSFSIIRTPSISFWGKPTSTPTPAKTEPTAIPLKSSKKEIKISILNGTGIGGQAGKLKTALEKLAFENIETGNAETQDHKETLLQASKLVSKEIKEEIANVLTEMFTKVTTEEASQGAAFDITITTGKEK